MSQTRFQLTLIGSLFLILVTGIGAYLFFAYLVYIFIGGTCLVLLVACVNWRRQHQLATLPLKAHELEEQRLAHELDMERERLQIEREKQEREQETERERIQIEREKQEREQTMEQQRLQIERERQEQEEARAQEKHTLELQIIAQRWELEQHLSLTRIQADERGYYPYRQGSDGEFYHLANPHLHVKQIAPPAQATQEVKPSSVLTIPAKYDLRTIWQDFTPSYEQVFLGMTAQGTIYVPLRMLWHIALTGPTGGGKTSTLRMLLMQLAFLKCHLTLCDIHYAPIKEDGNGKPIDWQPIEKRLAQAPIRDIDTIAEWMEWLAFGELQARIDRQYRGEKVGRPLFFTIEELPAVLDEAGPKVSQPLAKILRQGRQYSICFVGASQDLLTKTLNMSQGPRECFRTGYYTGGDPHTAKALLDLRNGEKIDEEGIGIDGLVYLKTAMHQAMQTRVGWASNESLYDLLDVPMNERLGRSEARVVEADIPDFSTFERPTNVQETFPKMTLVQPVEQTEATSDERPKMNRLSDVETSSFIAAYRASGNIDKALSAIKKGASYRDHARELVKVNNLRKDA